MKSIYICYDSLDLDEADKIRNMFELENIKLGELGTADINLFIFSDNSNHNEEITSKLLSMSEKKVEFITLQFTDQKLSDEIVNLIDTSKYFDMRIKNAIDKLYDFIK